MAKSFRVAPFTFILFLFFIFAPLFSYAEELDNIISKLQEKYESINTIEASFTQEAVTKGFKSSQVSEGKVYLKKPGKMRWIYTKPAKDELVGNGKMIWVYQPDLNQVIEKRSDAASSSLATDFLSGVGNLKKEFNISLASEKGGSYLLGLTPREPQPNLRKVSIEIDKTSYLVTKTIVEDHFGNETRVSFKNLKTNTNIKDSLFEFSIPKGANVARP
ncbi:MAG: outer membrane lipoprotein chaperone LolA [Deltaproteobacteria bacterium]|nr:outer membrane lipoprotein chaperone LolA [Deltaproteobacteria bacterium]